MKLMQMWRANWSKTEMMKIFQDNRNIFLQTWVIVFVIKFLKIFINFSITTGFKINEEHKNTWFKTQSDHYTKKIFTIW